MYINADSYTPINIEQIPLGQIIPVKDTPFDFTQPVTIDSKIHSDNEQIIVGKGYHHNFVLNKKEEHKVEMAAVAYSPKTGIKMEMYTDEPGVQFYSCGFMEGKDTGKGNKVYGTNGAFCLEAQHFPDSPNQPAFPATRLNPGDTYTQTTIYRFLTE